jgi:HEAT repeat protein
MSMTRVTPRQPDYSRSRAILIGTTSYFGSGFSPLLPAAANSLVGMRQILTEPELCGWPEDRVRVIENKTRVELEMELRSLTSDCDDVLLLYFVGHGVVLEDGELCWVLTDTALDNPDIAGLEYGRVRKALLRSRARLKIVILDCCYSGLAIENSLSVKENADYIADATSISGVYTLTASDFIAHVVPLDQQARSTTSFTKELLDLIRGGIPGGDNWLNLNTIYLRLRDRLIARDLPHPNQRGTDTAGGFLFTRNAAANPKLRIAEYLADRGDPRGIEHLISLAVQSNGSEARIEAAKALAVRNQRTGFRILGGLAASNVVDQFDQRLIIGFLADSRRWRANEERRGMRELVHIARNARVEAYVRRWAALALVEECRWDRGRRVLAQIAADPEVEGRTRYEAAVGLEGAARADDLFSCISEDSDVDGYSRYKATACVTNEDRRVGLFENLAHDPHVRNYLRLNAAEAIAKVSEVRGATSYITITADATVDRYERKKAVEALASLNAPHGLDHLAVLARTQVAVQSCVRIAAANALAQLGDLRGAKLLKELSADERIAAVAAQDPNCPNHQAIYRDILNDPDSHPEDRRRAAYGLAALGDPLGVDLLAMISADNNGSQRWLAAKGVMVIDGKRRWKAANYLLQFDRLRGFEMLAKIVDDPSLDYQSRRWCCDPFAQYDWNLYRRLQDGVHGPADIHRDKTWIIE